MKKTILTLFLLAMCVSISGAGITDKLRAVIAAKNAGAACEYTLKYNDESDDTEYSLGYGDTDCIGSSIIVGTEFNLDRISVELLKVGSPTGTVEMYIYDPDNSGSEGEPDDKVATSETVLIAEDITGSMVWYDFDFASPATLSVGTWDFVICGSPSNTWDVDNRIRMAVDQYISEATATYKRDGNPPGAANDSGNWVVADANGQANFRAYDCE